MQISLTNKGIFVLAVSGISLLLFLFSDNGRAGYEANPDVISLRRVFVTMVIAAEEAGDAIKSLHCLKSLDLHKKPALLQLDRAGRVTKEEIVTEADLISNYVIVQRIKLLRPDFIPQINSEERKMPQQSSIELAMKSILSEDQFIQRRKLLLSQLLEQDVFLHLRQISLWVDPLDATQEFSDWSSLGGQLSENLRSLPKPTARTPTTQNPLRILISRSHSMGDFSEKLRKAFRSTPIDIIAAGGSAKRLVFTELAMYVPKFTFHDLSPRLQQMLVCDVQRLLAGYKMIELARGEADLYIHTGGARRWDVCGPSTILQARGGVVRTLKGDSITFNHLDPSDLDSRMGIFAAASRDLFDTWASTVSSLVDKFYSP
ncbi:hypothetical protein ACTXT7_007087 [Hymenolepis weldensis]